jgi:hypothetical protein
MNHTIHKFLIPITLLLSCSDDVSNNRQITSITYCLPSTIIEVENDNETTSIESYDLSYETDSDGKITLIKKTSLADNEVVFNYKTTYDSQGNLIQIKDLGPWNRKTGNFTYNNMNQLTNASFQEQSGALSHEIEIEYANNRITKFFFKEFSSSGEMAISEKRLFYSSDNSKNPSSLLQIYPDGTETLIELTYDGGKLPYQDIKLIWDVIKMENGYYDFFFTNNLVKYIEYEDNQYAYTITSILEYDLNGYPTKVTANSDEGYSIIFQYTYDCN